VADGFGHELSSNDVFRAPHDVFGHATYGSSLGPAGETRGQNSWFDRGPFGRLLRAERPYPEQKNILVGEACCTPIGSERGAVAPAQLFAPRPL